jgi:hypothetical protein
MPSKDPEVLARAQKNWRRKNPDYLQKWREANPDKTAKYNEAAYERRKEQFRAYYQRNKEACRAKQNAYRKAHPEKSYARNLKRSLGITLDEKQVIWEAQNKLCKICHRPVTLLGAHVDHIHDHKPIIIRGLLCGPCNRAIGLFQDNPEVLDRAAAYLRDFSIII